MLLSDLLTIFPQCRLITGAAGLDRPVRWVHVVEQPDVANWLRSGDLVLVSGVGWPRDPMEQRSVVRQLIETGVAGILFASGRFLASVPEEVVSEAREADFPVIESPFDLRFADITEAAQRMIIGEYFEVTERADAIHRALTRAAVEVHDLGALADRLAGLLEVEVTIHRPDGGCLAHSGGASDAPFLPLDGPLRPEDVAPQDLPQHLRIGGQEGLLMPVHHGQERAGHLLLRKPIGTFGPLEDRVIQHAAAIIALHLLRQREIAEVERRIHASFLEALLEGAYPPRDPAARERVRLHGLDPDARFRIVIARLELGGPALSSRSEFEMRHRLAGIIETQCQAVGIHVLTTLMLSRVVLLWPAGARDGELLGEIYQRAAAAVGGDLVFAAGEAQQGIGGIPTSYGQAEQLLLLAGAKDTLMLFEDHLLLRLLSATDKDRLREFRDAVLGPIDGLRNGQMLLETVRVLTQCGGNQAKAATMLGLHRNTLRQRLRTLERVLRRPLDDPEALTRIHLAFVVDRMLERQSI